VTTPPEPRAGFEDFSLDPRIVSAIGRLGFDAPTPIQAETIPALLAGRDVIGRARTGSGKTAAFGLPLIERTKANPPGIRALVLTPTRELALQVTDAVRSFAHGLPVRVATVYGGAAYRPQLEALKRKVPVVIGTPGRVIDHLDRGTLDLKTLELLVLDEADEMLRMGFIEDVERVLAASPPTRQVALFSATMPSAIRKVAEAHLTDPLEIQVEAGALTTAHIEQYGIVVPQRAKLDALTRLLAAEERGATLVFARTRASCAEVADALAARGLNVDALHGDLSQVARERVLGSLRKGRLEVLIATDVASRGIDVDHITHVINLDLPDDHESYVHRIGRTGRAGRAGKAISLVTPRETYRMKNLERALKVKITKAPVPTDADIDRRRRAGLVSELRASLEAEPSPATAAILEELADGATAEKIAEAALRMLARSARIDPSGAPSERPPSWAHTERSRPPRPGRSAEAGGAEGHSVELFMPVGKARGVRPADVVGALTNDYGVNREQIGRITILSHKTFCRLHPAAAEAVLGRGAKIRLRGRDVPVGRARKEPTRPTTGPARRFKHKKKR